MTNTVCAETGYSGRTFFGHPRGLATLFFTEMWERFSYYGMRGMLILFLVADIREGGLGMTPVTAAAIYALYTSFVYLFALPGGWIADLLIGQRKAIWYGGILIALGQFSLAVPSRQTFFAGLVLIVLGTGMLKPNVSTIVGELYPQGGAERDAGFSVFYMGINLGAFIGPLLCGFLGENINWHLGFAAAGVGMVLGLIQYRLTEYHLGDYGIEPSRHSDPVVQAMRTRRMRLALWIGIVILVLVVGLAIAEVYAINPVTVAQTFGAVILILAGLYFVYILFFGDLQTEERRRVGAIIVFFFFSAAFWSGFEQAGSSLNLFAERFTDRMILGWEMPASWLQSVPALFIILFAPFFGWLWLALAKRNLDPSSPVKFAFGLIFLGLGFAVLLIATFFVVKGDQVLPTWLMMTYLLHTFGELSLSPVGLSLVTKLSPKKLVGQMMGIWFFSVAFGNLIAGLVAGRFDPENVQQLPDLIKMIVLFTVGAGLLVLLLARPLKRLMSGVK